MAARTDAVPTPEVFRRAAAELLGATWRPEIQAEEIGAPQRIAPYSVAVTADVSDGDSETATGRLVLLHDPAGNPAWQGTFRCVSFARAEVEPETVTDPFLPGVGWSWLTDALEAHAAVYLAPSGTVTSVSSESFGGLAGEPPRAEIEIRASWTPDLRDGVGLSAHVRAWGDLLCTAAGVPPLPAGVVAMPPRRSATARSSRRR